jgi:hypothetical protein
MQGLSSKIYNLRNMCVFACPPTGAACAGHEKERRETP